MRKIRFRAVRRDLRKNEDIELNFDAADIDLDNNARVSVYVLHREKKGGRLRRVPVAEFDPTGIKTWADIKNNAIVKKLKPAKKGVYTAFLVGLVTDTNPAALKRPVTYKGAQIRVKG